MRGVSPDSGPDVPVASTSSMSTFELGYRREEVTISQARGSGGSTPLL